MNDLILVVLFFGGIAGVWWFVSNKLKAGGKGGFVRHLVGAPMGLVGGFILLAIGIAILEPDTEAEPNNAITQTAEAESSDMTTRDPSALFSVLSDDAMRPHRRSVEVILHERVDEATLEAIGRQIKAQGEQQVERTFIGYRLEGQDPETAYWGTTHYNPNLEVRISGMTQQQLDTLLSIDVDEKYESPVGAWVMEGGFNYLAIIYEKDGGYHMDNIFVEGGVNTYSFDASQLEDGSLRLQQPDDPYEYYTVDTDGNLRVWAEDRNFLTVAPRDAAFEG